MHCCQWQGQQLRSHARDDGTQGAARLGPFRLASQLSSASGAKVLGAKPTPLQLRGRARARAGSARNYTSSLKTVRRGRAGKHLLPPRQPREPIPAPPVFQCQGREEGREPAGPSASSKGRRGCPCRAPYTLRTPAPLAASAWGSEVYPLLQAPVRLHQILAACRRCAAAAHRRVPAGAAGVDGA